MVLKMLAAVLAVVLAAIVCMCAAQAPQLLVQEPLCEANITSVSPSWCRFRNPTVIPRFFLGPYSVGVEPVCYAAPDGATSPFDECRLGTALRTFETSNAQATYKMLFAGLVQGGAVLFEMQYTVQLFTLPFIDGALDVDLVDAVAIGGPLAYVAAGSRFGADRVSIWQENSTCRGVDPATSSCASAPAPFGSCSAVDAPPGLVLGQLAFVSNSYNNATVLALLWLKQGSWEERVFPERIDFWQITGCGPQGVALLVSWTFPPELDVERMTLSVTTHRAGYFNESVNAFDLPPASPDANPLALGNGALAPRTLITLASESCVSTLLFSSPLNAPSALLVPFGNTSAPSTLVCFAPGAAVIDAALLMPELFRRLDWQSNETLLLAPSQGLWLVLALTSSSPDWSGWSSSVLTLALPEYRLYNMAQAPQTSPGNPLALSQPGCSSPFAWRSPEAGCVLRANYTQQLDEATFQLSLGTLGMISGNATGMQDISSVLTNGGGLGLLQMLQQLAKSGSDGNMIEQLLANSYQNTLMVTSVFNKLTVIGAQEVLLTANALYFPLMNSFSLSSTTYASELTANGMFLFAFISRPRWYFESKQRLGDICADLAVNTSDPFLQSYTPLCASYESIGMVGNASFFDFVLYASSCPSYCPDWVSNMIDSLPPGYFPNMPFHPQACFSGSYCPDGLTMRPCPPGFVCPANGMSLPQRCDADPSQSTTCAESGLVAPQPCPEGAICEMPYSVPIFAPPGMLTPANGSRSNLQPCLAGDWCSLGRSASEGAAQLLCPANSWCASPAQLEPEVCACSASSCSFCGPGTYWADHLCNAGYYCPMPNVTYACELAMFCPPGSVVSKPCPAGSYCPTPAQAYVCPAYHYCPLGTVKPLACPWLTLCPRGTSNTRKGFAAVFALVLAVVLGFAAHCMWRRKQEQRRRMQEMLHAQRVESLAFGAEPNERTLLLAHDSLPSAGYLGFVDALAEPEASAHLASDFASIQSSAAGGSASARATLAAGQQGKLQHERRSYLGFAPKAYPIDLSFDKLGLTLDSGRVILAGVTGEIRHGRLLAIMGPSGAGKTTLLTLLANRNYSAGRVTGSLLVNGQHEPLSKYRDYLGFVPQEDVMHRTLTVEENIGFASALRLPASVPAAKRLACVRDILETLDLYDVRGSPIGDESVRGISGGQRKRVNVALELVADVTVLLLDEPTSGLDSTASVKLLRVLRTAAERLDMTIVAVLHQPRFEIFTMFHDVLLLGKGGRTVYLGPSVEAAGYFASIGFDLPPHVNPPDFFMDVISGDVRHPTVQHWTPARLFDDWEAHVGRTRAAAGSPGAATVARGVLLSSASASSAAAAAAAAAAADEELAHSDELLVAAAKQPSAVPLAAPWPASVPRRRGSSSVWLQLWIFIYRAVLQQSRVGLLIAMDMSLVLLAGVFVGVVFQGYAFIGPPPASVIAQCPTGIETLCQQAIDNPLPSVASLVSLSVALTSVAAALRVFGGEHAVFLRERQGGSSALTYFMGKCIGHLPEMVLAPVIFLVPFYQLAVPRASFFAFWAILSAVHFASSSFGILCSILIPPSMAQLAAVVTVLINMMASGSRPTLPQIHHMIMPLPLMPYVSYLRYAQEALVVVELNTYRGLYSLESTTQLLGYSIGEATVIRDVLWILAIGCVVRAISFVSLVTKDRLKQH